MLICATAVVGCGASTTPMHPKPTADYLAPFCEKTLDLEFNWDGFKKVKLFGSNTRLSQFSNWYQETIPGRDESPSENQLYIKWHNSDEFLPSVAVVVVNAEVLDEIENLRSFVGSDRLDDLHRDGWKTIGVLYVHSR